MTSKELVSSESENSDEEFSNSSSHPAQQYDCPNCPHVSLSLKSHHRHLRSHLASYPTYECRECLVSFHLKEVYLQHKEEELAKKQEKLAKKRKEELKDWKCGKCKRQFYTVWTFNRHRLRHQGGAPYKCPICGDTFPSLSARSRHVKNHVVRCSLCDIYFQDHSELMNHIGVAHRARKAEIEPIVPLSPGDVSSSESDDEECPRNVVCFVCEQRFFSEESMIVHLRAHKLFACSECPRFFSCSSHLQEHELSHQRDEPESSENGALSCQPFGASFSTEELDKSEKPLLDFDNLLHFSWLMRFTQEVKALDLPLPIQVSEKLTHVISLLNIQLTYPSGLIDMGKNYQYFAHILEILSTVSTKHFLKLAETKIELTEL